jgi:hypothetical protein
MSRSLIRRLEFNFSYLSRSGSNFACLSLKPYLPSGRGFPGNPLVFHQVQLSISFYGPRELPGPAWLTLSGRWPVENSCRATLITLSGKPRISSPGEFPIPVPQASSGLSNMITIEYKPFSVGLNFSNGS